MILTTRNSWWIKKKSIKYQWNLQVFLKNSGNKVLIFIGAITIWFFDNLFTTTWAEISQAPGGVKAKVFSDNCLKRWPWNCSDFSVKQPEVCHLLQWKSRNFLTEFGNHQVVCLQSLTMSDSSHLWWGRTQPKDHWKINTMFFPQKWKVPFL